MKFLAPSILALLGATTALAGECGWERTTEKVNGVLETGSHFQGTCGGDTTCVKNMCVPFVKPGEACSEMKPCRSPYYCDQGSHVCEKGDRKFDNEHCVNNNDCWNDICLNGICRKTDTCGSTSDCGEGKVCRFTRIKRNPLDLEKDVRACAAPDKSKYGEDCESNADCGKRRLPAPNVARRKGPNRRRPKPKKVQLKCRSGICLYPDQHLFNQAFYGWPCRKNAHCRSETCKASTYRHGKLTMKTCHYKERQS
ncbi:hypothetical protein TMEN_6151 [Trichophyton mentagrophytes]|nr:hypothetical protein TMEN_6151 [Trichophyton mentagrophytes]